MHTSTVFPDQIQTLVTVINLVRTGQATTRPELGQISGLGRSVVAQRVEQAIHLGLLQNGELGPSTGGRSPRQLSFTADRARFVAIEFGVLHVGIAVLDLDLNPRMQSVQEWDIASGPDSSLEFVASIVEGLLAEEPVRPVWGVGVGVPGPVEFSTGRPTAPPIMPGWDGFDIRRWFESRFGAPTFVDNDVNLMAIGEFEALEVDHASDQLFVKVGSGIGAGVISGGNVHRGSNGAAGDVGHIAITDRSDIVCRCGQIGCLEAVAGGWALAREGAIAAAEGRSDYLADALETHGEIRPTDIAQGARAGDAVCAALISRSGRTVGEMLATLVNVLNPASVAVGGSIAEAGDLFLSVVRETVYRRSLPLATRDLRIVPSRMGHGAGVLGAGRLVAERVFRPESMTSWLPLTSPRRAFWAVYGSRAS
jgi:predicted NBD/HSP70 family sugar kinase